MGELIQFPGEEDRRILAAERIACTALAAVETRYGEDIANYSGYPAEYQMPYHNLQHSIRVRKNAKTLAEACGMPAIDIAIVEMAASAHDIVQLKPRGTMEQESATWLAEQMEAELFGGDDIEAAVLAILGTEPVMEQGVMTGQKAWDISRSCSSERISRIVEIVASADLADFFAPFGPMLGLDLYDEYRRLAGQPPSWESYAAFQHNQVMLARNYQFPHPRAEEVYAGLRPAITSHHESVYEMLCSGQLTSWQKLLSLCADFCRTYSRD